MKKLVYYALLEDMRKYIKGINMKDFEPCDNPELTSPSVIDYVRLYYDYNLPVDVTAWMRVNEPKKDLIYGERIWTQVSFVRDVLCNLWMPDYEYWDDNPVLVISTHMSKSVRLPVYQINLEKYGLEIVLRNNFHDWKVSIKSKRPLEFDYMELFDPTEVFYSQFCEGFPKSKVYGSYEQNQSQFTIEIVSQYNLYTFMFLLKNYLDNIND